MWRGGEEGYGGREQLWVHFHAPSVGSLRGIAPLSIEANTPPKQGSANERTNEAAVSDFTAGTTQEAGQIMHPFLHLQIAWTPILAHTNYLYRFTRMCATFSNPTSNCV